MALSLGQQDVAKRQLLICFLLAPSRTSFKGGKGRLELSFSANPGDERNYLFSTAQRLGPDPNPELRDSWAVQAQGQQPVT